MTAEKTAIHKMMMKSVGIKKAGNFITILLYTKIFFKDVVIASCYIDFLPICHRQNELHGEGCCNLLNFVFSDYNRIANSQETIWIKQTNNFVKPIHCLIGLILRIDLNGMAKRFDGHNIFNWKKDSLICFRVLHKQCISKVDIFA